MRGGVIADGIENIGGTGTAGAITTRVAADLASFKWNEPRICGSRFLTLVSSPWITYEVMVTVRYRGSPKRVLVDVDDDDWRQQRNLWVLAS
jgi:hypothetical protein